METAVGTTGLQHLVLRIVRDRRDLTPTEYAHILKLHPSPVTGILQRLVSRAHPIRNARHVLAAVAYSLPDMPERRLQGSGSRSARTGREA